MYTFLTRLVSAGLLFFVGARAHAQDTDYYSSFDAGIEGWTTFGNVVWSADVGYSGGSIHLDTQTSVSIATKCLWAEGSLTLVASARGKAHCPGMRFYVFRASKDSCSNTGEFANYFAVSKAVDTWEPLTVAVPAQNGASMIQLMLFNGGGCAGGSYFDDVMLQLDDIFNDGFALHGIDEAIVNRRT